MVNYFVTPKLYFYKQYKNGNKKRISENEYIKKQVGGEEVRSEPRFVGQTSIVNVRNVEFTQNSISHTFTNTQHTITDYLNHIQQLLAKRILPKPFTMEHLITNGRPPDFFN